MARSKQVFVRCTDEEYDLWRAAAGADSRSLSSLVRHLLTQHLAENPLPDIRHAPGETTGEVVPELSLSDAQAYLSTRLERYAILNEKRRTEPLTAREVFELHKIEYARAVVAGASASGKASGK